MGYRPQELTHLATLPHACRHAGKLASHSQLATTLSIYRYSGGVKQTGMVPVASVGGHP